MWTDHWVPGGCIHTCNCGWSNYCDYNVKDGSNNHPHNRNGWVNRRCNWAIRELKQILLPIFLSLKTKHQDRSLLDVMKVYLVQLHPWVLKDLFAMTKTFNDTIELTSTVVMRKKSRDENPRFHCAMRLWGYFFGIWQGSLRITNKYNWHLSTNLT